VLERGSVVGGNAGSFELAGFRVDYGSHRLHPACEPHILADIRRFLGNDLLDRPRHGRIRLHGRWLHFPLKPFDALRALPPAFTLGVCRDGLKKLLRSPRATNNGETFASVLRAGLGETICRDFYFPYAQKIWGVPPEQLSGIQARRRVRAGSLGKLFRKVLAALPGFQLAGAGRYYYPRGGYEQITRAYYEAARQQRADFRFHASVRVVHTRDGRVESVEYEADKKPHTLPAEHVWSTIPITALVHCCRPEAPASVLEAARRIRYRAMLLIYLVVEQPRFSEFDAHYFPEVEVPMTRLSEPRNYSLVREPADRTVLCAELPCDAGDTLWQMSDAQLGELVTTALAEQGIPLTGRVAEVTTRRLSHAYPIYDFGFEQHFKRMDAWLGSIGNLLTFGRQGLFAHDNTHHALAMAYAAVECLNDRSGFDDAQWARARLAFQQHVVED
jgi:protoporphyrinogen oxidase